MATFNPFPCIISLLRRRLPVGIGGGPGIHGNGPEKSSKLKKKENFRFSAIPPKTKKSEVSLPLLKIRYFLS